METLIINKKYNNIGNLGEGGGGGGTVGSRSWNGTKSLSTTVKSK